MVSFIQRIRRNTRKVKSSNNIKAKNMARRIRKAHSLTARYGEDVDIPVKSTFLASQEFRDHLMNEFFGSNVFDEKSVTLTTREILSTRSHWNEFVRTAYDKYTVAMSSEWSGMIIGKNSVLEYSASSNSVTLKLYGDETELLDIALQEHDEVGSQIEWVYSDRGESIYLPLNIDRLPINEMYPFLKERTLEEYYDAFLASRSNILLLIGPPGTGKTSFLRGLLEHAKTSAILTYDANILSRDSIFAEFMESDHGMMIMEDADTFLGSRTEGNTLISRFLNVGDGLISTQTKKLIFSTNLPSIKDIDPALLRPGRCFDVLEFNTLNQAQAQRLADKYDIELAEYRDAWTLAEIFNIEEQQESQPKKVVRSMGFV